MSEDAKELLTTIGVETTLRYAIQLITTSNLVAVKRKSQEVELIDVRKVYAMFMDVKRSSNYLVEHQKEYMFSENEDKKDNKMQIE